MIYLNIKLFISSEIQYPKPDFDFFFCSVTVCIEQSYC